MSPHTTVRPEFAELIDVNTAVRRIGTGFEFTEGPVWHPVERHLTFSDMPGDVRRRWDGRAVTERARPSHKGNGLTYDADLNLLVAEHSTSSVARIALDGTREVLASHYGGRELNSPNDLCVGPDGSVWFTDPWYGRMPGFGIERPRDLGWQGVFRIPPGHRPGDEPELAVERYLFTQPNGLCFSPDGATLYVNDTEQANIRAFEVRGGTLGPPRGFASGIRDAGLPGVPDGMKCDARGNVWVTAPGGLWVYDPGGRLLGKVAVPELCANLAWGGADWRTLFVCASHLGLCRRDEGGAARGAVHACGCRRPDEREWRSADEGRWRGRDGGGRRPVARRGHDARPRPLRARHPRHAERRGDGGRGLRRFRRARAREGAGLDRQRRPGWPRRAAGSACRSSTSTSSSRPARRD